MSSMIDALIEQKVMRMKSSNNIYGAGRVRNIQDFLIEASGLENTAYLERVSVGKDGEGYISEIAQNHVTVALTRKPSEISVGDAVVGHGEEFSAYFSPSYIGNVVDMFGTDKLRGSRFDALQKIGVETDPIPIMERTPVCRPMLTGIAGIDLLYPIGKGQRQLIIGDKKTGKTQIALDTIVNQTDKNMICIYVAVGKTKKEVKEIYFELSNRGAMNYTMILAAFNDECPPVLKNTPYAAMSMAEQWMRQGKDVLVVFDDLKRHADACREISLLSGKVPGRDAYPPDIFYAHASLLEKGCQHECGGSITVLPIAETKGGDITDYISTNIISITDGQIVLSAKNFEKGQKPAIQYGLSVSRLGGAVQTKKIRNLGAKIRRELLAYLETREIYELANMDEMSEELRRSMTRGKAILSAFHQYKFEVKNADTIVRDFEAFER